MLHSKNGSLLLALAFTLFSLLIDNDVNAFGVFRKNRKSILKQVFEPNQQQLEPPETLRLLKEIAVKRSLESKLHRKYKLNLDQLKLLIEASNISLNKCRLDQYILLNEMFERFNSVSSPTLETPKNVSNIFSYLEHSRGQQFAFCKDTISSRVKRSVERLTEEDVKQIELLINLIEKKLGREVLENACCNAKQTHELAEPILAFMKLQAGSKLDFAGENNELPSILEFEHEFDRFVGNLIRRTSLQLKTAFEPLDEMNKLGSQLMDGFSWQWFRIRTLLRDLLYAREPLIEEIYNFAKSKLIT